MAEHYSYLSEPRRHEAYRAAVAQAVRPGDLVADLGCGFGVLGFCALRRARRMCGGSTAPRRSTSPPKRWRAKNRADRYSCIREFTFRAELPQKVDLLICDHVGYFGVDYGIVAMLDDARRRLLKPGGRVIPQALNLEVAGIASQQARDRLRAWDKETIPAAYSWLSAYAGNSKHNVTFSATRWPPGQCRSAWWI